MRMLVAMAAATLVAGTATFAQQKAPAEAVAFAKKVASANTFEIQSSELAKDRSQTRSQRWNVTYPWSRS